MALQCKDFDAGKNGFIRVKIEKQRRTSVSRKAAKRAKKATTKPGKVDGIAKTLDQVLVIQAVHYEILLLDAFLCVFASLRENILSPRIAVHCL